MRPIPPVETIASSVLDITDPTIVAVVSTRENALAVILLHEADVAQAVARCHAASIRAILAIRLADGSIPSSRFDETLIALAHPGSRARSVVARLAQREIAPSLPVPFRVARVTGARVRGRAGTVSAVEFAHGLANAG